MRLSVNQTDVWAATIDDQPGGVAEKLAALADAGADLGFILARRTPELRGQGVVFVSPIKGRKQIRAADAAGFEKTKSLHLLRIDTINEPGLGARLTRAVAEGGVNLRGVCAAVLGNRSVIYLAVDTAKQVAKAAGALKRLR